jgi:nicotinamide-nucleotide amidase
MSAPVVELLATGDELLTGQIVDTNSPWLMDRLWDLGIMVRRKTLVGDDRGDLAAALAETTSRADVVVMSGGLGPTEDDLTAECVAAALGVPLVEDAASLAAIQARFEKLGRAMTPNNAKQARFPRGAAIHPNRWGTAPAFSVRLGRAELFCLPGVPLEYRNLADEVVLPRIAGRAGGGAGVAARLVKLVGIPESHADEAMRPVMDAPSNRDVRFGYRAHWPEIHVKWSVPGPDADGRADAILAEVRRIFGDAIFAEGKQELAPVVVERLQARGERLALAESCTGGLVAEMLTRVPGASNAFDLGVVVYANAMKTALVEVPADVLAARGAVSEEVARALAEGARRRAGATWGIGITGIAGPGGGTPEKPVGTVHMAIAGPGRTTAWMKKFFGDRDRVRKTAAYDVLNQLRLLIR